MNSESIKDVAIVIVGLNSSSYLKQCINSLYRAVWQDRTFEIIYVDNGSTDNTLKMLNDLFPYVKVIANSSNLGFCKASNQGARMANSRYYFFLNDDTIVYDNAIPLLIGFLDQNPHAGAIASRLLNPDMSDQWSGRRFPSPINAILGRRSVLSRVFPSAKSLKDYLYKDLVQGKIPFQADWVSAAAMMVRKEIFHKVGGFAEDYYYWHEAIICDRIRKVNMEVFLHPMSRIMHYEGKGSGSRPYNVRKFHIINFHLGAYRCYCEHYNIGSFNPLRWFVASALGTRAMALLAAEQIARLRE